MSGNKLSSIFNQQFQPTRGHILHIIRWWDCSTMLEENLNGFFRTQWRQQRQEKAIGVISTMIIFPIFPFVILAIFYMYWIGATLYILSLGEIHHNDSNGNCCAYDILANKVKCEDCCGYNIHYIHNISLASIFHIFGGYWITQFTILCCVGWRSGCHLPYQVSNPATIISHTSLVY